MYIKSEKQFLKKKKKKKKKKNKEKKQDASLILVRIISEQLEIIPIILK